LSLSAIFPLSMFVIYHSDNTAVNSFVIFFLDFSDIIAYNDSKRMGVII